MTPTWVNNQSTKFSIAQELCAQKIVDIWNSLPEGYHTVFSTKVELFIRIIKLSLQCHEPIDYYDIVRLKGELEKTHNSSYLRFDMDKDVYERGGFSKEQFDRFWLRLITASSACCYYMKNENPYVILKDTNGIHMTGDIVIAKPSNIIQNTDLESIVQAIQDNNGIAKVLYGGKWGFGGYDLTNKTDICAFTTHESQICVAKIGDVLKINPDYKDHIMRPYACTYIKDFDGTVRIAVKEMGRSDDEYKIPSFTCCVQGQGIDMNTKEPMNFSIDI